MFIDSILEVILRPFREIARVFSSVGTTKSGVAMDLQRVRQTPNMVKNEIVSSTAPLTSGGGAFGNWGGGQGQQSAQPSPQAAQGQKKKMSWWPWSKKTCIRCSQKLHKSWDQCPYCGQSQSAPVLPGAPPGAAGV